MKILWVTFIFPNPEAVNGSAFVMHGQLAVLSARHEVTIVGFAAGDAAEKKALDQLRASGYEVYVVGEAWPTSVIRWKRNCERMLSRVRGRHPRGSLTFRDLRMQHLLDHLLDQQGFDLIHVEDIGIGRYRYQRRIPSVLTEREVGRSLLGVGHCEKWKKVQPLIWREFDRIQVFAPRDAAAIRAVAPELADRVRINPFGVDIPEEADPRLEEPDTAVFVGGFNHPPNVDAALWIGNEIMPLLRNLRPGIRLTIVGSYPTNPVRALGSDDIIVTGRVPAIEPYLDRTAVVLAPVRLGGGMRVKVLQAMAMGKAVVTTPLGAEGLAGARDSLPLAFGETAEEIAIATTSLLASREERHALGRRARAFVKDHHSWSAYATRLEAIYAELFSR